MVDGPSSHYEAKELVTIVTAYNASYTIGETTNFRQQQRILTNLHHHHKQNTTAQPRRQFILDLKSWLQNKIQLHHDIILAMYANTTYNPDTIGTICPLKYTPGIPIVDRHHNGNLSTLVASCGLIDPLAKQHSTRPFRPSHNRGSERIDFIFTTPGIASALLASGSMPFHSLFNCNHRPYYLDLNARELFADLAYEIPSPAYRKLFLLDPRILQEYYTTLHTQLTNHKIFDKLHNLKQVADTSN